MSPAVAAYALVFLGGGLGSCLRFALGRWAVGVGAAATWGTLLANVLACALLGYLAAEFARGWDPRHWRLLLATGFCGGFSTFSTFSLEAAALFQSGRPGAAALYVGASLALGLAAVMLWPR